MKINLAEFATFMSNVDSSWVRLGMSEIIHIHTKITTKSKAEMSETTSSPYYCASDWSLRYELNFKV